MLRGRQTLLPHEWPEERQRSFNPTCRKFRRLRQSELCRKIKRWETLYSEDRAHLPMRGRSSTPRFTSFSGNPKL
jgi:hypothetical protein